MNHVILFGVSFKGNAVELIRSSVFWVGYNNAWNQNENDGAHTKGCRSIRAVLLTRNTADASPRFLSTVLGGLWNWHTMVLSAGGVGWGFKGAGQQLLPDY
jgi:hypothetical protein